MGPFSPANLKMEDQKTMVFMEIINFDKFHDLNQENKEKGAKWFKKHPQNEDKPKRRISTFGNVNPL